MTAPGQSHALVVTGDMQTPMYRLFSLIRPRTLTQRDAIMTLAEAIIEQNTRPAAGRWTRECGWAGWWQ